MLSKARLKFLAPNHTTGTMPRMHTELRIVVMQRTSTCLPNMDESQLNFFFFDLSNDINKVMSYILERVVLFFDPYALTEDFAKNWTFSTQVHTHVDESKHIDVSWRRFSDTRTLSRLLASYTRDIFEQTLLERAKDFEYPAQMEAYMQEGSEMAKIMCRDLKEFLEECYDAETPPRPTAYVGVLVTTEEKRSEKTNRLVDMWKDDDNFRKTEFYPELRKKGWVSGDKTIAIFLPIGQHIAKKEKDERDIEMKRVLRENSDMQIEFVVLPWHCKVRCFASMTREDFDKGQAEVKDEAFDNKANEHLSIAQRVSPCLRFCNVVTWKIWVLTACRSLQISRCFAGAA